MYIAESSPHWGVVVLLLAVNLLCKYLDSNLG